MPHSPQSSSGVTQKAGAEKTRPSIYWFLAAVLLPIGRLLMKQTIKGGEKLPKTGPFILAPNHYSEIDPVVMGIAVWKMGRIPRFLAKGSLFRVPVVGWILRKAGQIPVEREGATRGNSPIEAAGRLVETGGGVIVYPEGTLTRDPDLWPMRGKTGAARMALTHGLPLIPAAHWGTQRVMPRYGKRISLFPPKPVTIIVGDPVDLSAYAGRPLDAATLGAATADLMSAVTALLEEVRGESAPVERWDPSTHNQKETGRFES